MIRQLTYTVVASLCFGLPATLTCQDSISVEEIRKFSYSFDIENGEFVGEGAAVLAEAISASQVFMLGNNSRNQQESELDLVLSKLLDQNQYNTLIMEIGPASANIVNRLSSHDEEPVQTFKKLNQHYHFEAGGNQFMPIPDFKYLGTAKLLKYIKEQGWSFDAIGVDSWVGYKMQLDELYNNLPIRERSLHQTIYKESIYLLDSLYAKIEGQSYEDVLSLTEGMKSSTALSKFLQEMSYYSFNADLVKYIQFSIDYWWMYGNKQGYKKNMLSSKRNKSLIKKAFEKSQFNFDHDKLFLKMWRGHLTNGVTRNGFWGVGNMLMELAAYHGHQSLNVAVLSRYSLDDKGEIKDILDKPENIHHMYHPFVELGQKDKWVLIDLRPFNKEFYWGDYIVTLEMERMMRRYDMILIPKTDSKAQVNN